MFELLIACIPLAGLLILGGRILFDKLTHLDYIIPNMAEDCKIQDNELDFDPRDLVFDKEKKKFVICQSARKMTSQ